MKVAVVTGANKGIGFAIVRALCKKFDGAVYLTARDEGRGQQAVRDLESEGLSPKFHQLDLVDPGSIDRLRAYLSEKYGGIDILVNNAAIAYKNAATEPNFTATVDVCNALFPLLRSHARVVHVSSRASTMSLGRMSPALQQRAKSLQTMADVQGLMAEFVAAAKGNKIKEQGWANSAYGTSKIGVTAMTPIQQKNLDADKNRQDVIVNSCCPGYVNTDMTSHKGNKTIDEGADTPVYLALLPENATSPRGNFVAERNIIEWQK